MVGVFAAYATAAGIGSLNLQSTANPPTATARVGALAGIEAIFLLEFGLAAALRRRTNA